MHKISFFPVSQFAVAEKKFSFLQYAHLEQ